MNKLARIARKILEKTGLRKRPFYICDNPALPNVVAGRFSYGNPMIMGTDGTAQTRVTFGKYCSIADGVRFLLKVNHPIHSASTFPLPAILGVPHEGSYDWCRGPIVVGHDVWIGQDAVILGGVTIGNGAIVANHAIVTKDVPPYGIVAGNPARLVKSRFDEPTIARLLEIQWWDWSDEFIKTHAVLLAMGDISQFLKVAAEVSENHGTPSPKDP